MTQQPSEQDFKDAAIRAEGEAMLAAIQKPVEENKPLLVDASGAPLNKTEAGSKVELSADALRQNAEYQLEQRRMDSARKLEKIIPKNNKAARVRDIAYLAYQLLFWSRMELSTNDEISDEMIEDMEFMLQWSIYKNAKSFEFKKMLSRLKNFGVPALKEFEQTYNDLGRARAMRMNGIKKILGDEGIPTTPWIEGLLGNVFAPGKMLILRGDEKSTRAAMKFLISKFPENAGSVFVASSLPTDPDDKTKLPASWWANAASSMDKLNDVLDPVTRKDALMLCVDNLAGLFTHAAPEPDAKPNEAEQKLEANSESERRAFAIKRLYQWCVENTVAVILCDNTIEPVRVKRPYGYIPFVPVVATGTVLSIGGDTFTIGE
jgi:hypothetical protein